MADLRGSSAPRRVSTGRGGKIVGAIIVVAAVVALGAWSFQAGMWNAPKQTERVASSDLPSPPALPAQPLMKPTTAPPDVTPPTLDTPAQTPPKAAVKTARVAPNKRAIERAPTPAPAAAVQPSPETNNATTNAPAQTVPPQSALTPPPAQTTTEPPQTTPDQSTPDQSQQPSTPQQP
ncbi:MAG: hypothetical protein HY243_08310 [Proteobacteria bacterium]|nr:hypothetical protein [Pseudomonadota bacterium]